MTNKKEIFTVTKLQSLGRIADDNTINLSVYADGYYDDNNNLKKTVEFIPKEISFSKEIGRTIYDVTAKFDDEGKQSMLSQFQKMVLSTDL